MIPCLLSVAFAPSSTETSGGRTGLLRSVSLCNDTPTNRDVVTAAAFRLQRPLGEL